MDRALRIIWNCILWF